MSNIELEWVNNKGEITIKSQDIITKIEIDTQKKEIKNVKKFFREIIFMNYYKNWDKKVELIANETVEIKEVKTLINELIEICNKKLEEVKKTEVNDSSNE